MERTGASRQEEGRGGEQEVGGKQTRGGIGRLFQIAGAKKGLVIISCVLSVISTLASFIPYVSIYAIIEELLKHSANLREADSALLIRWGWTAFLSMAASFAFLFASIVCSHMAAFKILYLLKIAFARHMAALPLGFHTLHSTGKLRKVMDDNIEKIEGFIAHQLPDLVGSLAAPVVMLGMMLFFDWKMGLVCLIPLLLSYLIQAVAFTGKTSAEFLRVYQDHLEDMNNSAVEYVRGIAVVKTFNQTVFSFRRFHSSIVAYKDFALKYTLSMKNPFVTFIVLLNSVAVFLIPAGIILGSRAADQQAFALSFLFYLIFGSAMSGPIMKLMYVATSGRQIVEGTERMDKIFAVPALPVTDKPEAPEGYDVRFDRVSFAYRTEEGETRALNNISFLARQGQITALVGPSGSGKSTIAHLVPRFWDVTEGSVRIGGVDVRDMDPVLLMER
ncbi:ABC transporter ATP-binding protein [Paenibacillus sp. YN15]|uniref:ABC transporter ATP-binding protein n=1 Tax=Paenibacillus sp. YN15 TaxID=1742774 RepID=UPI00215C1B19|nr:ABC transporter ATP-binding protein [Paenibacillus sp. YN15]